MTASIGISHYPNDATDIQHLLKHADSAMYQAKEAGRNRVVLAAGSGLGLLLSGFGAFVAARQSWLQWNPPEIASCGRDFYGMIETFPLKRAIPMIFKGSGDCTKIDWTFLGGSIANWSFLCFCGLALVSAALVWRLRKAG